jgi:predicted ABC-type ATPase
MAVARVAERVRLGGHDVPDGVVRRRYARGLDNFFRLYRPQADRWWLIDNAAAVDGQRLIAAGERDASDDVVRPDVWNRLLERHR